MLEPTDLLAELLDDSPEEMDLIKPVSTLLKLPEKEAAHSRRIISKNRRQPEISPGNLEAYSWGVGEDESGDGLYCGFEGVVRAAVIGV